MKTNDQLLHQAANAADHALKLTRAAWEQGRLPRTTAEQLSGHARELHCAATELELRAREAPAPIIGTLG